MSQGQALYSVDGVATVLLYGSTPAWRDLSEGVTGTDVAELNADLTALGDARASELDGSSDTFGAATATAVKALQASLGEPQTGSLTLGQVAFAPTALRITSVTPAVGAAVAAGSPVLSATSTTRQVTFDLAASQRSEVKVTDAVTITLPGQQTTTGSVSSIGTSASSANPPAVVADVALADPGATGTGDQEPVDLAVTTGSVTSTLAVPVAALTATGDGRPAVSVMGTGGPRLVAVSVGLFDDANGMLQVRGDGLSAGERVVLPST